MRPVLLDRFDVFDLLVAAPGSLTGVADWLRSHVLRQAIWMKESCQRRSDQERPGQSLLSGRARLIAAAIALLALALRLHTLSVRPLWDDEAWTLSFVYLDNPWQIISFGLTRFNPPLLIVSQYLISWIGGHLLGTTPSALRAPSVLLGVLGVAVIYEAGAVLFAPEVALTAATFSAVNVLQIMHSQEMRMYPLFLLLSWSSICLLVRTLRTGRPRQWVLYGAVTLLVIANTINAAADIEAIASGVNLIAPVPVKVLIVPIGLDLWTWAWPKLRDYFDGAARDSKS